MGDPRWRQLPLTARALWVEMSVLADGLPDLRSPSARGVGLGNLAGLIEADQAETLAALGFLADVGIAKMLNPDNILLEAF